MFYISRNIFKDKCWALWCSHNTRLLKAFLSAHWLEAKNFQYAVIYTQIKNKRTESFVLKIPYLNTLYYKEQLTRVTLQTKSITKEGWRHFEANLNHPTIQQWQTMRGLCQYRHEATLPAEGEHPNGWIVWYIFRFLKRINQLSELRNLNPGKEEV